MTDYKSVAMAEIARRQERAKRLLALLDIPAGLDWDTFCARDDVLELDLDFVTLSQMYDAYRGTEAQPDEKARRLLGADAPLGDVVSIPRFSNKL